MQAISLRPQKRLIVSKRIALYLLVVLIAFVPALSLPLTMVMPLFLCPLMWDKDHRWIALLTLPMPALAVYLHGYHPAYAIALLLVVGAPTFAAYREYASGRILKDWEQVYMMTVLCSTGLAICALCMDQWQTGVGLAEYVAGQVEQLVMHHPNRTKLLYQIISTGLLPVPEGYNQVTLLNLTLDPVFLSEVRLMLRSRVMQAVEESLPSLLMQSGIIIGLFIHLRILRMWGSYLLMDKEEPEKIRVAMAPSFATFRLSERVRWVLMLFCLFYFVVAGSKGFVLRLAQVLYYTFETLIKLQGGAALCNLFTRKNADRRVLAGIAVAVLYLALPFGLFLIGCFENVLPFREQTEDDKNEREKNEEEEP